MLTNNHLEISDTIEEAAAACAALMTERLQQALGERPYATLALSGGNTPAKLFPVLAKSTLPWERIHIFFADERMVPPSDRASNFRLAKELLFEPAGIPASSIHRIHGESDPQEAANAYEAELAVTFDLNLDEDEIPSFDVLHLGMGPDAHTASLFPGESAIDNLDDLCAAVYVAKMEMWRVTLLPAVLQAARCTVFLAGGADKAEPLQHVLGEPYDPRQFPAQLVRHNLEVRWFLDKAASHKS
ncbi:MAG: 6-phosphogluconolactonase [Bryobacterales bacterium]|nr:6-phosphogluconolactonase [Bryobacterales bacterium]